MEGNHLNTMRLEKTTNNWQTTISKAFSQMINLEFCFHIFTIAPEGPSDNKYALVWPLLATEQTAGHSFNKTMTQLQSLHVLYSTTDCVDNILGRFTMILASLVQIMARIHCVVFVFL